MALLKRILFPPFPKALSLYLLVGSLLFAPEIHGEFGFNIDGTLDKKAVSHAYFEGEFSRILPPLETFRQSYPNPSRDDQIFVYKYLSVIYAADSSTRKKAESYMIQLLKLMPTIELIDLYISDNIQAIFKDVKETFLKQQKYVREHDIYGHPSNPDQDSTARSRGRKGSSSWVWWTAGGVSLTAVAATLYFVDFNSSSSRKPYDLGN